MGNLNLNGICIMNEMSLLNLAYLFKNKICLFSLVDTQQQCISKHFEEAIGVVPPRVCRSCTVRFWRTETTTTQRKSQTPCVFICRTRGRWNNLWRSLYMSCKNQERFWDLNVFILREYRKFSRKVSNAKMSHKMIY